VSGDEANDEVQSASLRGHDAGLCLIRARVNGTKAPEPCPHCGKVDPLTGERMAGWELFQSERPDRLQVRGWFAEWPGMGIVCGAVSGNLEVLELEGRAVAEGVLDQLDKALDAAGLSDVWNRIRVGYTESSPSGGLHWLCRISDGAALGSQKLAQRLATSAERAAHPKQLIVPLIETRAEGGFIVVAPSHGSTHPSGKPWELVCGDFDTIATITAGERNAIYAVCRLLDRLERTPEGIAKVPPAGLAQHQPYDGGPVGASWMDAVERHLSATDSLSAAIERYGWVDLHRNDPQGCALYERPGQDERGKVGGLVNASERLVVFSTSTPFASTLEKDAHSGRGPTYSLLDVYAAYEHEGERQAAAQAIAEATGILRAWRAEQDAETARMFGGSEHAQGAPGGDKGDATPLRSVLDLLNDPAEEYDWIIDGLIERLDRVILTGKEGGGKSTLLRQIGIAVAAGLHPLTFLPIKPLRVLAVDCENSKRQLRREFAKAMRPLTAAQQRAMAQFIVEVHTEGLVLDDLADRDGDRRWLEETIAAARPDLLLIGPLYKMIQGDPADEPPSRELAKLLDRLRGRYGFAIALEAHTPHDSNIKRPYGWSGWKRWPEFGLHLDELGALTRWRGDRDGRAWPSGLVRGTKPTDWLWRPGIPVIAPTTDPHQDAIAEAKVDVLREMRKARKPLTREEVLDRVGRRREVTRAAFLQMLDEGAFSVARGKRLDKNNREYPVDEYEINPVGSWAPTP
jgi:hypothetical protein